MGGDSTAVRLRRLRRGLRPIDAPIEAGPGLTPAGVLALIDARDPTLPLLLLRRHQQLRSHPGQVALPGGRPEPEDGPLWQTALREAEEELGIPASAVSLQGLASSVPVGVSRFVIFPFVGLLQHDFPIQISPDEVEAHFWFPLLGPVASRQRVAVAQGELEMPGYRHQDHFVWGATGKVVEDLMGRLG